jgi:hypothetical protein
MSNPAKAVSSWQDAFNKEITSFMSDLEQLAGYIRKRPDDRSMKTTGKIYRGMMVIWAQVERIREIGLNMAVHEPKSPLVLQHRDYWFVRALADQSEFEDECDRLEFELDRMAKKVFCREADNLWVAAFLETEAVQVAGDFGI